MKIAGRHRLDSPRESVWKALLDPKVLSGTLPGFQSLEQVGENEYEGALNIKVGPVQGQFRGRVKLTDLDPPNGYRLKLSGKGAPGFVDGDGTIRLEEEEGGTGLVYDLEAQVGGRIAGVGQRLLDSSAKVLTREALDGLGRQLTAAAPEATADGGTGEAAPPAPAPEAPSQAEFAARVAKGVAADLVPQKRRPLVFAVGLILYTAVVVLITRACAG